RRPTAAGLPGRKRAVEVCPPQAPMPTGACFTRGVNFPTGGARVGLLPLRSRRKPRRFPPQIPANSTFYCLEVLAVLRLTGLVENVPDLKKKGEPMERNFANDLAGLDGLSVPELRHQYATLFGEPTWVANRAWLVKRIAWRMQALAEG